MLRATTLTALILAAALPARAADEPESCAEVTLAQTNRDLLASKSLYVERTTANARVFYRLRVAGFADQAQTQKMCEALRSRNVDCIPVTAN